MRRPDTQVFFDLHFIIKESLAGQARKLVVRADAVFDQLVVAFELAGAEAASHFRGVGVLQMSGQFTRRS